LPGIHYKTILQTAVIPFHRQNYWSRWFADGSELFQVRFVYNCHNLSFHIYAGDAKFTDWSWTKLAF